MICRAAEVANQQVLKMREPAKIEAINYKKSGKQNYSANKRGMTKQKNFNQQAGKAGVVSNMTSFKAEKNGPKHQQNYKRNSTVSSTCSRCVTNTSPAVVQRMVKHVKKCKKLNHIAQVCKSSNSINEI